LPNFKNLTDKKESLDRLREEINLDNRKLSELEKNILDLKVKLSEINVEGYDKLKNGLNNLLEEEKSILLGKISTETRIQNIRELAEKIDESILRIDKKQRCFFLFTFSKDVDVKGSGSQNRVLGIDFGINNLAVTSDCKFFNSHKVKQIKRKFKFIRAKLQAKGTQSARRLLRKISGREQRFMAWVNHNISKQVVSSFDGNKIIMENLKGIRKQRRGKRMNYWISNWSFYQLQSFIQYKAERKGIEFVIRKIYG